MARLLAERRWCEAVAGTVQTADEFHRLTARFLTLVGDGHTALHVPLKTLVRAPLELAYVSGQVMVSRCLADSLSVDRGDVLLEVDGEDTMAAVTDALALQPSTQGSWGIRRATQNLLVRPAAGGIDAIDATVAQSNGRVMSARIPLLPADHVLFAKATRDRERDMLRAPFVASWTDDGAAAMLAYRVCADRSGLGQAAARLGMVPDEVPILAEFAHTFFARVAERRVATVVLDIRGNAGGDATLAMRALYPYLFAGPITTYGVTTRISPRLRACAAWARDLPQGDHAVPPISLAWPFDQAPGAAIPADRASARTYRFDGSLVVLIDAETFSAGEWLAVDLYDNHRATFVGEPTGGGGSVPGEVVSFTLPATGATLRVPVRFFTRPGPDVHAVKPHCYRTLSREDVVTGRDPVMDAALAVASR